MSSDKTWTRRAALGSLASGSGLLLFGTGGSTQISSYRDVEVNAGDDEDAVIQFVDSSGDAGVVKSDSPQVVYEIRDNVGVFSKDDISVTATVGTDPVLDEVIEDGDSFKVKVSCPTGKSGLNGKSSVELDFEVSNVDYTISATRTTESKVDFDCYDFGSSNNYRDSGGDGSAAQPNDPKGTLKDPGNVNADDDVYATATAVCNSDSIRNNGNGNGNNENENGNGNGNGNNENGNGNNGDNKGGRIGYALPTTQQNETYELYVNYKSSTGSWQVYLRSGEGTKLTEKYKLTGENEQSKSIEFTDDDNVAISDNADNLYLIFETTSSGNCVSVDIDYFELRKTGTNSN